MEPIVEVASSSKTLACRRKFLGFFRKGFHDPKYEAWERGYKVAAHEQWEAQLGKREFAALLQAADYEEIAARAVRIESRTNLLRGLYDWLHGRGSAERRFARWDATLAELPRRQTRVHTWPAETVFGFIARPDREIFLKPNVTRAAAQAYGVPFEYTSRPSWSTYASLLAFAERLRRDLADLEPRDLIDIQSFIWVLGSSEYD